MALNSSLQRRHRRTEAQPVHAESESQPLQHMGVWKGVAMDCLKFHSGLPCPTLLCRNGRFRCGPPAGQSTCGHLLPLWTPHVVRLCFNSSEREGSGCGSPSCLAASKTRNPDMTAEDEAQVKEDLVISKTSFSRLCFSFNNIRRWRL
jgi:hypothetical protein